MRGLLSSRPTSPVLPSSVPLLAAHNPGGSVTPYKTRGTTQVWHWVRLVGLGFAAACLLRAYTPLGAVRLGADGWSWGAREDPSCSSRGLEEWGSSRSNASIKIRVRPSPPTVDVVQARVESARDPIRGYSFHPQLAFSHYDLFPPANQSETDESGTETIPAPLPPSSCIEEATHVIDMLPAPDFSAHDPTFFFSYCTTPGRAITYGPTWTNYLGETASQRSGEARWTTSRPGCLIVDASDKGVPEDREKASEFLEKIGTTCVMHRSSRDGHRYEMRVLGLIQDAWEEAERRKAEVSDYSFGILEFRVQLLTTESTGERRVGRVVRRRRRRLVVRRPRRPQGDCASQELGRGPLLGWLLGGQGSFRHVREVRAPSTSCARAGLTCLPHNRIAYGGAGMIISRSLMKKMYDMRASIPLHNREPLP